MVSPKPLASSRAKNAQSTVVAYPSLTTYRSTSLAKGMIVILSLMIICYMIAWNTYDKYPNVEEKCQLSVAYPKADMFCENDALKHVKVLADDIGNRLMGTQELRHTEAYIKKAIREIMTKTKLNNQVDVRMQMQHTSGSFLLENFIGKDVLQAYDRLTNIAVRIDPYGTGKFTELDTIHTNTSIHHEEGNRNALLLNSHYDSALSSPGGTDDGVPVGVMLSLLKNLVTTPNKLKSPVILLFNGGEEFGMHAAHGWITQHEWSKDVKTIINLESCGGGQGRPLLFQAGPGHGYVVKSYQSTSAYPQASVIAQDLIKMLPADTDYRVFIQHLNYFAAGVDLAYTRNGFVYHTKSDNYEEIHPGAVQHMGETVFGMVHDLTSNYLTKDKVDSIAVDYEPLFLDIMGIQLIVWKHSHQLYAITAMAVLLVGLFSKRLLSNLLSYGTGLMMIILVTVHLTGLVLGLGIGLFACVAFAGVMVLTENSMVWYSTNWLSFGLYGSLFGGLFILFNYGTSKCVRKLALSYASETKRSVYEVSEEAEYWALQVFLLFITSVTHLLGMRSGIVYFSYMVLLTIPYLIASFMSISTTTRGVLAIVPAALIHLYSTMLLSDAAWPFFGRLGKVINAEFAVAAYCGLYVFLNMIYILPYLQTIKKFHYMSIVALILGAVSLGLTLQSSGRVFSSDRPRRTAVMHVRKVNNETGIIDKNYVSVGFLDAYSIGTSLNPLAKSKHNIVWSKSEEEQELEDYSSIYPVGVAVNGARLSYGESSDVGKPSSILPKIKVLQETVNRVASFTWRRSLRLEITHNVKGEGLFSFISFKSPFLKSWSLDGEIRRDKQYQKAAVVKLVGEGHISFDVHLEKTILNDAISESEVKDEIRLPIQLDTGLPRRDETLQTLHELFEENKLELSEIPIQTFQTEWTI